MTTQPVAAQHPYEVVVREVWATAGDPGFSLIAGMVQWPDGTVWVGDDMLAEVTEVSADGRSARLVLRAGEGPGEMGNVQAIAQRRRGGVVILTPNHYHLFGPDKRFQRRVQDSGGVWPWGFLVTPDEGFLVSGGFGWLEGAENTEYAVHFFNRRGRHRRSWHPVADHDDWETVRSASGGPMAFTRDGGLIVSDAAPFRITRYDDLDGNGARVVVEDERILSSEVLDRAVTRGPNNTTSYHSGWTKSFFVQELVHGPRVV